MAANIVRRRGIQTLILYANRTTTSLPSSDFAAVRNPIISHYRQYRKHLPSLQNPNHSSSSSKLPVKPAVLDLPSSVGYVNTDTSSEDETDDENEPDETDEQASWEEEEDNAEAELGDGGDGGGINLQNCHWGERALSIAREVLLQFGEGIELFAFKTSPRGYIYVRLENLANKYGCPTLEEMEDYNRAYKIRIDEAGELGEIPKDLGIDVSSPGAEHLLKVPEDLERFKTYPMRVKYVDEEGKAQNKVFLLVSVNTRSEVCVWRLANVIENRDPEAKGRPMTRSMRDWRLKLPFSNSKVGLYL